MKMSVLKAVQLLKKISSNANGNDLSAYDNGTILIVSKGISGEQVFLFYFFFVYLS